MDHLHISWITGYFEIDESLDFNENMSTNTAFNDVSWNDVSFFWEITFKKLFIFKVIYFLFSTDETQISYLLHVIMKQDI